MLQKLQILAFRCALISICFGAFVVYGSYIAAISNSIKTPAALVNRQAEIEYHSALAYAAGEGVEQNMDKTLELMTQSAEHGFSEAQLVLGNVYYQGVLGQHHSQDYKQAYKWYSLAADNGSTKAPALRYEVAAFLSPAELTAVQQEIKNDKAKKSSHQ